MVLKEELAKRAETVSGDTGAFRKVLQTREIGILVPLVVICIITGLVNPAFLSIENILNVLRSISFTVIVGVGMTFVLISGGLDLSVGSVVGLTGMITGWGLVNGVPVVVSIMLGILSGIIVGLVNGFTIVRFKIPPLIVTLGMMYIARGVVHVISRGRPFYPFPESFNQIAQGSLYGIPNPIFIAFFIIVWGHFILNYTTFGRCVMAIGGNEETARTSGINIRKTKVLIYCIVSALSAFPGILMASRLSSAQANAGSGWELTVIASVIIGGTSMFGGAGSVIGTVIGASIMAVLTNAMVLMRVSVHWQNIVVGAIIVLAVGIDTYRRNIMSGNRG